MAASPVVESGAIGRPNFVGVIYNVALRQMAARQFGHWMFRAPGNILLEQAVHPLSQLVALAGPIRTMQALPGPAVPGRGGREPAGEGRPHWQTSTPL